MIGSVMLFTGSAVITAWGIAHILIPTTDVIRGFGPLAADNRRILLMEWIMEGVLLVFLGSIVAAVRLLTPDDETAPAIVYRAAAATMIVMAGISAATGARTSIKPMKFCPYIFVVVAMLFYIPTII